MGDFENKTALVVGATGAVGLAICAELMEKGAAVVVCDADQSKLDQLVAQLKNINDRVFGVVADTARVDQVKAAVSEITKQSGTIDILVNHIDRSGGDGIACISDDCWSHALDSNLNSAFYFCREVVPIMQSNQYGRVINVSGIDYLGWSGKVDAAATKAAAFGLTRGLALEVAKDNVTVNCVVKGDIEENGMPPEEVKQRSMKLPVKQIGQPKDISRAVAFFASQASKYITGQMFFVCGGKSLYASMSV